MCSVQIIFTTPRKINTKPHTSKACNHKVLNLLVGTIDWQLHLVKILMVAETLRFVAPLWQVVHWISQYFLRFIFSKIHLSIQHLFISSLVTVRSWHHAMFINIFPWRQIFCRKTQLAQDFSFKNRYGMQSYKQTWMLVFKNKYQQYINRAKSFILF